MPVVLPSITIPDIPEPPEGYLVLGLDVRGESSRVVRPYTTGGWEEAASLYVARGTDSQTFTAFAWWAESFDLCDDGRERLVTRFDPQTVAWSPWAAEERVSARLPGEVQGLFMRESA